MAESFDVAVMHDFFIDRMVSVPSLGGLAKEVDAKARDGGGGIHGVRQIEVRGGNAVNLAHALSRLGLRTLLITHALGSQAAMLRHIFEGLPVELRVKQRPAGLTVAFEEKVNVMLGDAGGASDFGPELLTKEDWSSLKRSKLVCSVNWAANSRGTDLLLALRERLGEGHAIFIDPADFRDRVPEFKKLLALLSARKLVDWVSMNEEEAKAAASAVGIGTASAGEICSGMARKLGVVFDLHGLEESYSSDGYGLTRVRSKVTSPRRLTGAGDVWDSGAIYGRLRKMDERRRLEFASTAARLYLENPEPISPRLREVNRAL